MSFRIISEQTHKFKKEEPLFVILFKDFDKFGIDLADSNECLARFQTDEKKQIDYIYHRINEMIITSNNRTIVANTLTRILSSETFAEAVLEMHTENSSITRGEIYALTYMLDLSTTERHRVGHTISIYESGQKRAFGEFVSKLDSDKYFFFKK
jgi:hypothetical protein